MLTSTSATSRGATQHWRSKDVYKTLTSKLFRNQSHAHELASNYWKTRVFATNCRTPCPKTATLTVNHALTHGLQQQQQHANCGAHGPHMRELDSTNFPKACGASLSCAWTQYMIRYYTRKIHSNRAIRATQREVAYR